MDFNGKNVIVTGGTAGIGKDIAKAFAKAGANVVIFGTNPERAAKVEEELEACKANSSQKFMAKLVNVASTSEVNEAVESVLKEFGSVDVLINNAGITRDGLLMKMKEEDWDSVIDVNLKSAYNLCKALVRPMMKAKSGKIVNISSVVGLTGNAGQVNYSSSKSGVIGFTKALAQELATRGVNVNCIAPGFIETQMTDVLTDQQKEGILVKIPGYWAPCPGKINATVLLMS